MLFRGLIILLLALHPAALYGERAVGHHAEKSAQLQPDCECCDAGACSCGCSAVAPCTCAAPEPASVPLPAPAPLPSSQQFKPLDSLAPAATLPTSRPWEAELESVIAGEAWTLSRTPMTSCDSAQALHCIWTT